MDCKRWAGDSRPHAPSQQGINPVHSGRQCVKGGNGGTILSSESHTTNSAAKDGIASCKSNSSNDSRYVEKESSVRDPFFILKGGNGETIGTSEMYSSATARDNGIKSCKENGPTAPTEDLTA